MGLNTILGRTKLAQRPFLNVLENTYYEAFLLLTQDRPLNTAEGGIGYIPLSSKQCFLEMYPEFDRDSFVSIITGIDLEYVHYLHQENKKKPQTGRK